MTDRNHPDWFNAENDDQTVTTHSERRRALRGLDISAANWFNDVDIDEGVEIDGTVTPVVSEPSEPATSAAEVEAGAGPGNSSVIDDAQTEPVAGGSDGGTTAADIDKAKTAAAAAADETDDTASVTSTDRDRSDDTATTATAGTASTESDSPSESSDENTDGGLVAWVKSLFGLG